MATITRKRSGAAALLALLTAVGLALILATSARASGVTPQQLEAHGWTCFTPPPPFNDRIGCFDPGRGRPFPGNPDPRPSYSVLIFDAATGDFLETVHLIRADLYRGQPCGSTGEPYRFIERIGYYECVHG